MFLDWKRLCNGTHSTAQAFVDICKIPVVYDVYDVYDV